MDKNQYRMWAYAFRNFPDSAFHNKEHIKEIKRDMRKWANNDIKTYSIKCDDVWNLKVRQDYQESPEYFTRYGIIPDNGEDIEQLKENLHLDFNSAYDCTGLPFTRWIKVFRCKIGIGIIHAIGIDM